MRLAIAFGIVLLFAAVADAATWKKNCGNDATTGLARWQTACLLPTSNSDDGQVVSVGACENIDVDFFGDRNGDGTTASLLVMTLQTCPVPDDDATVNTDAERDAACEDTTCALTGGGHCMGVGIGSGFVRVNMSGTHSADPQISIKCNGGP